MPGIVVVMYMIDPESPTEPSKGFNTELSFLAGILFAVGSITDLIDGWLARKWNVISTLGKFLDPLADKLMVLSIMVMMVKLERVPAWIVIVMIGRETAVTALRSIASSEGIIIAAGKLGKYKTVYQVIAILGLMAHYEYTFLITINYHLVGMFFLYVALLYTIWSGLDYFIKFWGAEKK